MSRHLPPLALLLTFFVPDALAGEQVLIDLGQDLDSRMVDTRDATHTRQGGVLRVVTGHKAQWPGITFTATARPWDLTAFTELLLEVKNIDAQPIEVHAKAESVKGETKGQSATGKVSLPPGEAALLRVPLTGKMPAALRPKLFGMRGYPGGWTEKEGLDLDHVVRVVVFVSKPARDQTFEIRRLVAAGQRPDAARMAGADLFPLIDCYGQYRHADWPGKIQSAEDLDRQRHAEAADLAAHPGPVEWNQYGGWQAGPHRAATGFFRVEKLDGRWWLIDPAGRLFWSHGIDCVRTNNGATPISDREFYFADLPAKDSPAGIFYGRGSNAAHGYYEDKRFETFNFTGANLQRKYGPDWKPQFQALVHRRLRSWGLNTIANWSDEEIYLLRQTPYTATVGIRGKTRPLAGSTGYWGKFTDVFDPAFPREVRQALAREVGKSAGDPWCLGYFVDNELSWGDELSLALATLASPADQPAKQVFVADLQQQYETIGRLNAAWGSAHASWDALRQSTTPPDKEKARAELGAFYSKLAERYFEVCRDAVKAVAPQQLYLGCRFAWANDRAVRAACRYCDVVSFNRYRRSVADLQLPEGCDRPAIIGEFHFGALDRGMFHTGLVPTANQQERAAAYQAYVRSALEHPLLVGTHWFQFGDQATTGRSDGENYQIGFLDVCDTPYPETIEACRAVGAELYAHRERFRR